MITFFLKILAAVLVSLLLLIGGAGSTIGSTLIYSLERGSEGIRMPFDEASLAGKLSDYTTDRL